jgi:hypothetical protein
MTISQREAIRQINRISDRHAFNRYTVLEATKDEEMGYLIECFMTNQPSCRTPRLHPDTRRSDP